MAKWQLQEAKNRLSEVVKKASDEGPPRITLRGDYAVLVVAAGAHGYAQLTGEPKKGNTDELQCCGARRSNPWTGE